MTIPTIPIDVQNMTNDQINAIIARLIGWIPIQCTQDEEVFIFPSGAWFCKACGNYSNRSQIAHNHMQGMPRFTSSMDAAMIIVRMIAAIAPDAEERDWHFKMTFATQLATAIPHTSLVFEAMAYWSPEAIYKAFLHAYSVVYSLDVEEEEVDVEKSYPGTTADNKKH